MKVNPKDLLKKILRSNLEGGGDEKGVFPSIHLTQSTFDFISMHNPPPSQLQFQGIICINFTVILKFEGIQRSKPLQTTFPLLSFKSNKEKRRKTGLCNGVII